jgi:adenosylcobinamide-GDP ribazoletransferase
LGAFAAAFRFLTCFPLPGRFGSSSHELAQAVPFFPLVGLFLGCLAVPIAWLLFWLFPPLPAAVLLTFVLLAFSGGLHLDGLADTADGFFSTRTKERMLEIMRDSSVGPMGAMALFLLLLFKVACLASMPLPQIPAAVFLMPLAGRTALVLLMALLPYSRPQGGMGSLFPDSFNTMQAQVRALAAFVLFSGLSVFLIGLQGLYVIVVLVLVLALFAALCRHRIQGLTGDTLGAGCELAEAAVALVFVLQWNGGF